MSHIENFRQQGGQHGSAVEGPIGRRPVPEQLQQLIGTERSGKLVVATVVLPPASRRVSVESRKSILTLSPVHPEEHGELELIVNTRKPFHAGGQEEKFLVEGTMSGEPVSLIERPDTEYAKNWLLYEHAGLHVVQPLWRTPHGSVVMPDLKARGGELYGKGLHAQLATAFPGQPTEPRRKPAEGVDELFMELTDSDHIGFVEEKIDAAVAVASEHGLTLPYDDLMELFVEADGTFDIVHTDLEHYYPEQGTRAFVYNSTAKKKFLSHVFSVRELLQQQE